MPRLHIQRYREARGKGSFFDPHTDIRRLVPFVLHSVLSSLIERCDLQELKDDFIHIDSCVRVWELRLLEDPTPANTQVGDFLKALVEVDRRALSLVVRQFVTTLLLVYSLFVRRDSATDSKDLHAMLEQARQAALKEILPPGVYAGVKAALENSGATLLHESETPCDVYAVVEETGEEIHGIKELARMCVQADPDTPWDVLADLCDKEFSRGVQPDRTQIALGLAYPDYKRRSLVLETDGSEGEAETPEGAGKPSSV